MLLNLSDISGEPLQSQIVRQLRAKILNGLLSADDSLPSIRALAREAKVSVITVERAYGTLESEGLIYSRRGKGFFVAGIIAQDRKELAIGGFGQKIEPVILAAINEGLSKEEIIATVKKIINNRI